jgi:type I restriction enzyme R subunit
MERNVAAAVKLYSGDKPIGLFADRLPHNLARMNASFAEISAIFHAAGIDDFMKLPDDLTERAAFAKSFQEFNKILEAAKIQGFTWAQAIYEFDAPKRTVELAITQHQYLTLLQRYKELGGGGGGSGPLCQTTCRVSFVK